MTKITQCEKCKHWKPKRDYWTQEIRYYCELTGYRSKDGWKQHKCEGFHKIEEQSVLEEFS